MGIKSTRYLSRAEAIALAEDFRARLTGDDLSNEVLGNVLDELAEAVARVEGRPCFDNYVVVDTPAGSIARG